MEERSHVLSTTIKRNIDDMPTFGAGTNIAAVLLGVLGIPGAELVPLAGNLLVARPYG
jgi:hypothetical protein